MKSFVRKLAIVLLCLLSAVTYAQQQTVRGKVVDETGEPVVGAAVFYEGTDTASITDIDGEFQIPFKEGLLLTFSCIGMNEVKVPAKAGEPLNVTMQTDKLLIEDAVVIGYGTVSKRDLTGSVSSVKMEEIKKSGSSNALGALQGRVAGLSITSQSGEPGSGFNIKIRGNNSINAGTSPLFVIDGMQMEVSSSEIASSTTTGYGTFDPMSFINPSDIESIEVLKDASATAIYGARGANGVILITTKSGLKNLDKTSVNLEASFGLSENPRYIDMLDAQGFIDYRYYRGDYGYDVFGVDTDYDNIVDRPKDASKYLNYNWQDLLYRKALTQNYNVSMTSRVGGGTQLAASVGYLDQEGLVVANDYKRYTGRIKLDHKINDKWTMGASVNFGRTESTGAVNSGNNGIIQYIYLERPVALWYAGEADEFDGLFGLESLLTEDTYKKTLYDRLTANAYINYSFAEHWKASVNASAGTSSSDMIEFYSSRSKWGRAVNGKGAEKNVSTYNYNVSGLLEYTRDWAGRHHFDAMAGGEVTYYNNSYRNISAYNFEDESTGAFNLSKASVIENPSQSITENAKISFISRANYNYRQRYYLTATFRADGSSKFAAGHRVGYFPSVSAAWRISEEPWLKSSAPWINQLKLRLSAGASGNDRIGDYKALSTTTTVYYAQNGTEIMGMALNSSSNPNLKWETTYQYDAGIDFGVLDDRIALTADVYYKDTRDMLYNAIIAAQSGFNTQYQNLGRVENKGVEIALVSHNISRRDFSWTTNLAFDLCRNKVLDIGDNEYVNVNISGGMLSSEISRIMVGEPIGIGWGYKAIGNYQLDDFVITRKGDETGRIYPSEAITSANFNLFNYTLKEGVTTIAGKAVVPGDRKYLDLDGDNEITTADRTKISDSNPKFTMSMGNTFTWKNWDLNIFLEGVYGRTILNEFLLRSESGLSAGTASNNLRREAWEGRWTPENPSNTYSWVRNNTNSWCSDYYVEDGSYLRIKTLSLAYRVPERLLKRLGIASLSIGANVDNLHVFTSYSGNDPDVSSSTNLFTGFDRLSYPKPRTYTLNLNIGF